MSNVAGQVHSFAFYGNAIHGLTVSDFIVSKFTRNGLNVSSSTLTSLNISEVPISTGFYLASYVPDNPGNYLLALSNLSNSLYITELVDIDPSSPSIQLTQDVPYIGALKPTGAQLQTFTLLVFNSKDWDVGRTKTNFSIAQTGLDTNGNWLVAPLNLLKGTYHIIIRNQNNQTRVIFPYLVL